MFFFAYTLRAAVVCCCRFADLVRLTSAKNSSESTASCCTERYADTLHVWRHQWSASLRGTLHVVQLFMTSGRSVVAFCHVTTSAFPNVIRLVVCCRELTYREAFRCILTAVTILSGQGGTLNIEPLTFYQNLYQFHIVSMTEMSTNIIRDCKCTFLTPCSMRQ